MGDDEKDASRDIVLIDFAAPKPTYHLSYSERMVYNGIAVSRCTLPPNPGILLGGSQFTVAIHDDDPLDMKWRLPSALVPESRTIVRDMAHINPADHPIYQRWSGTARVLVIAMSQTFLDPIINEAFPDGVELSPRIGIDDPDIANIAKGWRKELEEGGAGGRLFTESLGTVMALHILRTYGIGRGRQQFAKGGLGPIRLNRVIAYIDANLETDMGLRDLAAIAELSPGHFAEQFKVSTGTTLFRFILERRIGRAKELLLNRDIPIAEVALRAGFADQSHFTVNFRKLTNTTPARFRADST